MALAALETYVRRSYRAYSIQKIDYNIDSDDVPTHLTWEFQLRTLGTPGLGAGPNGVLTPINDSNSAPFKRIASISDMSLTVAKSEQNPTRIGAMVPVQQFDDVEDRLVRILESFPKRSRSRGASISQPNGHLPDPARLRPRQSTVEAANNSDEVTNVLIISIRKPQDLDTTTLIDSLRALVADYAEDFDSRGLRRVTFLTFKRGENYPSYYTFRGPTFQEDESIRHIEPALAYQIELSRLSNFNITPVFTENHNIHVYSAVGKDVPTDKRFFTRAVVRPGRLKDDIPTAEYLISETDRLVGDILDALQIIGPEQTDLNHIFINFTPALGLDPQEVEDALGGFIERFGRRLWRLRVTAAEIRIVCTDPVSGIAFPLRVIITNVSGFVIKIESYAEVKGENGEWFVTLHIFYAKIVGYSNHYPLRLGPALDLCICDLSQRLIQLKVYSQS